MIYRLNSVDHTKQGKLGSYMMIFVIGRVQTIIITTSNHMKSRRQITELIDQHMHCLA
jgi:hypothetical protein